MEFSNVLYGVIGGAASALTIVIFLGKKLVLFWLGRELESYKGTVIRENNDALERLKNELQVQLRAKERAADLELTMERYRGPLVHAAYDLQSRIYNLICQNVINLYFVRNLGDGSEKDYFIKNTMYLISQYFAWTEIIRQEIRFIEFQDSVTSRRLSALQDKIYSIWQSSGYYDSLGIWAGEQRGIGELMLEKQDNHFVCIGYAKFLTLIEKEDNVLFLQLQKKVIIYFESIAHSSKRLIDLQHSLVELLEFLDPEFSRFPRDKRNKI